MATFYNQATLSYNGTVTNSNVATGEILGGASITKTAISGEYRQGGTVTYAVSYTSVGGAALNGVTLTDDLGAYTVGTETVYPLGYVDGTARLYVNGTESEDFTVTAGPPLVFSGINIPAGANVLIIYEAMTNAFTPRASGSAITNTVTDSSADPLTATATVTAADEMMLTISKSICPETVTDGGTVNYTFVIQNTGNTAAVATDDLIVTDVFDPILTDITVTLDGTELTEGTEYTYDQSTGVFSTVQSVITVPAATYTQDATTGIITVTPGVSVLKISGTV